MARLKNDQRYLATIEPWHGHQVVVYAPPSEGRASETLWVRQVIDDQLKWGHAVWCADLDNDGDEELIVGVRDPFNERIRYGVNVYKLIGEPIKLGGALVSGGNWQKHVIDNGGVAVEDLAAADLNGDNRIDIVAVGRATGNVKIYWNEGK